MTTTLRAIDVERDTFSALIPFEEENYTRPIRL
jgi:hypothetical protein